MDNIVHLCHVRIYTEMSETMKPTPKTTEIRTDKRIFVLNKVEAAESLSRVLRHIIELSAKAREPINGQQAEGLRQLVQLKNLLATTEDA